MTTTEIELLADMVVRKGVQSPFYIFGWLIVGAVGAYIGSYLRQKGENAATKEDVECLTQTIKSIEHKFDTRMEELRSRNQLKLAALDKRLSTHQKAYELCYLMKKNIDAQGMARNNIQFQCSDWWRENCLYLGAQSRQAFEDLVFQYSAYDPVENRAGKFKEFMEQFFNPAIKHIVEDVELPSLGEGEEIAMAAMFTNKDN